jgi:RHS repeat-associated protein
MATGECMLLIISTRRSVLLLVLVLSWLFPSSRAQAAESPLRGTLGFQGEWHNPDGTLHLRARTYHPGWRRFLQRDRYAGSMAAPMSLNRYTFAESNPTTWSDPTGFRTRKGPCIGCTLTPDDLPFWATPEGFRDAAAGAVKQNVEGGAALACLFSPLCATSPAMAALPAAAGRAMDALFGKVGVNTRGDNYTDGGTIVNSAVGIASAGAGVARSLGTRAASLPRWTAPRGPIYVTPRQLAPAGARSGGSLAPRGSYAHMRFPNSTFDVGVGLAKVPPARMTATERAAALAAGPDSIVPTAKRPNVTDVRWAAENLSYEVAPFYGDGTGLVVGTRSAISSRAVEKLHSTNPGARLSPIHSHPGEAIPLPSITDLSRRTNPVGTEAMTIFLR